MPPVAMSTITVTQQHGQQLLDFSQKLDISLLDNVVGCLYNGEGQSVSFKRQIQVTICIDC